MLEGQEHLYHFYGNTTDLYTKGLERRLVLLWQETRVHENSVKGFHGGDEYVAILYEVSTIGPILYEIFQYPQHINDPTFGLSMLLLDMLMLYEVTIS
jgi:hypothetical protein